MAECMFPFFVEREVYYNQEERFVPVPCGKCPECLKRRTASWAFRLEKEAERWSSLHFITLTYNAVHIPLSKNGYMSLCKHDLQCFFKRLRKRSKFRYYAVGEYGTKRKRPHYHLILFGDDTLTVQDIYDSWKSPESRELIGDVYFGDVKSGSIRYTVQYYDKGDWKPKHVRDDREPEFSVMSKGLGSNFLTENMVNHLLSNPAKGYIYENEGRKIAIPRYYKKRIYSYEGSARVLGVVGEFMLHPSFLVHRDQRKLDLKKHNEAIKDFIQGRGSVDGYSADLHQAKRQAIDNYRKSKRKTRD